MIVQEYQAKKLGKGVAICKTKMKNLLNGNMVTESLNSGTKYEIFDTDWKTGTYSYHDEATDEYAVMDMETFEEFRIPGSVVGEAGQWIAEGCEIDFEVYEGKIISTKTKGDIVMEIAEIKSDNGGRDIQVLLSNGVTRSAPNYLKVGDKVLLNKNFEIAKRV